jgi:hydroxyethylthiazole kinase
VIVKGNADEIAALHAQFSDLRCWPSKGRNTFEVRAGHRFMAQVTGLGCAAGAMIAACAAVERDPAITAAAALTLFGVAGQRAATRSAGPGSFAVHFIDELAALDAERLTESHT